MGFLSGFLAGDISSVYEGLTKPPLAPPGWLFGVVWPVLYAMMGAAVYQIYRHYRTENSNAIIWFSLQLLLNLSWSIVFFRYELFWAAAVVIILLDILLLYTIVLFRKIDRKAAWLLVPYLLWILFATYLNIGFALLN